MGTLVDGLFVGAFVDGLFVGALVGFFVGALVGFLVGDVGLIVGRFVGMKHCAAGLMVGGVGAEPTGAIVGDSVPAATHASRSACTTNVCAPATDTLNIIELSLGSGHTRVAMIPLADPVTL